MVFTNIIIGYRSKRQKKIWEAWGAVHWSLVRENQQSSAHNFVKDFSLILPKSCRRAPLKEGAVPEISLEYGKTEVQTLFEPLQRFH